MYLVNISELRNKTYNRVLSFGDNNERAYIETTDNECYMIDLNLQFIGVDRAGNPVVYDYNHYCYKLTEDEYTSYLDRLNKAN